MEKLTWKEAFKENIKRVIFFGVFLGGLATVSAFFVWGIPGCIASAVISVSLSLLWPVLDKITVTKCSCGKVLYETTCPNCGKVCQRCGKKIE